MTERSLGRRPFFEENGVSNAERPLSSPNDSLCCEKYESDGITSISGALRSLSEPNDQTSESEENAASSSFSLIRGNNDGELGGELETDVRGLRSGDESTPDWSCDLGLDML
ncbi:hypothetical protein OGAPHI_003458 [Ogataea philodendri]|uniref:Uncharacterized protein n=1 Tax=Ogataea philodendri TaxID=1378263 RepID=A0A9P8P7W5_9ASCO|nr:uncharacterized protein OGAPHI_003458 [Ogataea philodendri]KAH3666462.1 hypothetical protein OGAPHI_003458 [Ogataea philodendri]